MQVASFEEIAIPMCTEVLGGHETMLLEWLRQARDFGLHPTIYSRSNWKLADRVQELGFTWKDGGYGIDCGGALRRTQWVNFLRTFHIARGLPRSTPILLAPGGMQFGLVHVFACLLARRNIVCYVPMTYDARLLRLRWPRLRDWLATRAARCVTFWITISDEQKRRLGDCWMVKAPIYVIPNRLRILESPPLEIGERSQGPGLRLLYAGRFEDVQKGLSWIAAVLLARHEWMRDVTVTFKGEGSYRERLEALSSELGSDRVKVQPWTELKEAFATHDALILSSRFEGLPLVAIEAIWAGIPVIATRTSGLGAILSEECIFDASDLESFRAALDRVRSAERRNAFVVGARQRIGRLLDPVSFREAVRAVVTALAALPGRSLQ